MSGILDYAIVNHQLYSTDVGYCMLFIGKGPVNHESFQGFSRLITRPHGSDPEVL